MSVQVTPSASPRSKPRTHVVSGRAKRGERGGPFFLTHFARQPSRQQRAPNHNYPLPATNPCDTYRTPQNRRPCALPARCSAYTSSCTSISYSKDQNIPSSFSLLPLPFGHTFQYLFYQPPTRSSYPFDDLPQSKVTLLPGKERPRERNTKHLIKDPSSTAGREREQARRRNTYARTAVDDLRMRETLQ